MSESGFSGLPPGLWTGKIPLPQTHAALKAKIIALRGEIRAERVRQKLEGEIIERGRDGTARIRTDKGEISVRLPPREIPLEGTRVEIEIPPGNPPGASPRQITVRPAPQHPAPTDAIPSERVNQTQTVPRLESRTAENLTRQGAEPALQRETPPVTLHPDDIIRLLPLPREQIQDIVPAILETVQARVTSLPATPQISPPQELYERISPQLTLPYSQHAALQDNLPQPLPVFTQQTARPVPQSYLETLPIQARTPVQQIIQYILQANAAGSDSPFTLSSAPLAITPQSAFLTDDTVKIQPTPIAAAIGLPAANVKAPIQTVSPATAPFAQPAAASVLDAQIKTITPSFATLFPLTASEPSATTAKIQDIAAATITQNHYAGDITAIVTGTTPQNFPVLGFLTPALADTPQYFFLPLQTENLPNGTQVTLTPHTALTSPSTQAALAPFIPAQFFSNFSWPALEELTQALQHTTPQALQSMANLTPNPAAPARMTAAALFFIAAVRSGDISGWLGEKTTDTLRRIGKGDILNRLNRDAGGLQRAASESSGLDWRSTALPLMWDGNLHKMMLHYRHDRDADSEEDHNKRGTRFIFDLNLSRIGALQLDGLHRAQPGSKARLDLIVRTTTPLSPAMQQTMRQAYIEALEQTDVFGELSFQNKREQFIQISAPNAHSSSRTNKS